MGYLIRRLDENAGAENFLCHAFRLQVDSPDWQTLEQAFVDSYAARPHVRHTSRRTQDRDEPQRPIQILSPPWQEFNNEPDTDFALPRNSAWGERILHRWHQRCEGNAAAIPLVMAGDERYSPQPQASIRDPSRLGVVVGRYVVASRDDIDRAVICAREDRDGWRTTPTRQRRERLDAVAQEISNQRGDLMGAALAETGKILDESDPEISEAIDFTRFYGRTEEYFYDLRHVRARGRGVIAVVSPWNFPLAIPCGGIAAAVAAGNCVILKPASSTVMTAYQLCQCFWGAGISQRTLEFVPCLGNAMAGHLVSHSDIDGVILTGGTATALAMLNGNPRMNLMAETGGKNATIVTAMSDRDQAIRNVVHSAFSHSGQKCSATSLLILEQEVYEDRSFRETLCDAVASRSVGSAWDLPTRIGPLIRPPSGDLERGLKELEQGESWTLLPHVDEHNRQLISPGIKWDVQPGSFTHVTEFFGPLLAVIPAKNLREAMALAHQTGYGLTAGLESLDDREQQLWQDSMRAGTLYINRPTTGAIVLRQPFGGWGKSSVGPGVKAGGPNYVVPLLHIESDAGVDPRGPIANLELAVLRDAMLAPHALIAEVPEEERLHIASAIRDYDEASIAEFQSSRDHFLLGGQDNFVRYRPYREIRIRIDTADTPFDTVTRVAAARGVGCRTTISTPIGFDSPALQLLDELTQPWGANVEIVEKSDEQLTEILRSGQTERIRYSSRATVPDGIVSAAAEAGIHVMRTPVSSSERIELLGYVREQSLSSNYHRYGNLGSRLAEPRREFG